MLRLALFLCPVIVLLFILIIIGLFLKKKVVSFLGVIMAVCSITAMILFIIVQRISGNPDKGHEFGQLYFPIIVFSFFIVSGCVITILSVYNKKV